MALIGAGKSYEFDSSAAILLVIIGIVMVMEYSSGYLRQWVQ